MVNEAIKVDFPPFPSSPSGQSKDILWKNIDPDLDLVLVPELPRALPPLLPDLRGAGLQNPSPIPQNPKLERFCDD